MTNMTHIIFNVQFDGEVVNFWVYIWVFVDIFFHGTIVTLNCTILFLLISLYDDICVKSNVYILTMYALIPG